MRAIGALLCSGGLAAAAFLGFIALVAFSDAGHICHPPGADQCSEARRIAATGAVLAVTLLFASLLGLCRLGSGRRQP